MCKRREKCGSVSSSLDSQKCKRDRERERETQPPHSRPGGGHAASGGRIGSAGLLGPVPRGHLWSDRWIEMWNVFSESGLRTQGSGYRKPESTLAGNQGSESLPLPTSLSDPGQVACPFWASVSHPRNDRVRLCFCLSLPEQMFQDSLTPLFIPLPPQN